MSSPQSYEDCKTICGLGLKVRLNHASLEVGLGVENLRLTNAIGQDSHSYVIH